MITENEYQAIKAKMDNMEWPTPEEIDAMNEYAVAKAKAALAANPVHYPCPHCGGENVISSIDEIVRCEWCGEPLLMDGFSED